MKTFTLLAVTGGLFFSSLCLNSKNVKANLGAKSYVKHCVKKCCNNVKKVKCGSVGKAISVRG